MFSSFIHLPGYHLERKRKKEDLAPPFPLSYRISLFFVTLPTPIKNPSQWRRKKETISERETNRHRKMNEGAL